MTWHEAMERYGIDKPDLRFGMELVDLTDVFAGDRVQRVPGADAIKGIRVPGRRRDYGRNKLDELTDRAKQLGRQGPGVDARSATAARSTRRSPSSCPRTSRPALVDALGRRARRPRC